MDALSNITNWQFLNEPLYRWFLFLGALLLMNYCWADIVDFMKPA